MKVVHLINSMGRGGAERQLSLLASEMLARGIDQAIVALRAVHATIELDPQLQVLSKAPGRTSLFSAWRWTIRETRHQRDSILVAWMYHSWAVAFLAWPFCGRRTRLVLYCRHGEQRTLQRRTRVMAWATLRLARWARVSVVFNSRAAEREHLQFCKNLRSFVVPNGVRISPQRGVCQRNARPLFGFLGRNHPDKGADLVAGTLAKILAACPAWDFLVAGPGMKEREPEIFDLATSSGIDVWRIRVCDSIDASVFFRAIDILVLPSRTESFPNVVVEAMAASVLVAANAVGDVAEILAGQLPVANDGMTLPDVAIQLARLPTEERERIGIALAEIASEKYALDKVADLHQRIWIDS